MYAALQPRYVSAVTTRYKSAGEKSLFVFVLLAAWIVPVSGYAQSAAQKAAFQAMVDRQMLSWSKAYFSIAAGDWAPDGELISPGGHLKKAEIQGAMTDYFKHFKDLKVVVKRVILSSDGKEAAIEWDWNVVRIRDGAQAHSPDCIIVDLENNKIKSWREYFDFGGSIEANP
jgi:ketosteroid isomerase-like protein